MNRDKKFTLIGLSIVFLCLLVLWSMGNVSEIHDQIELGFSMLMVFVTIAYVFTTHEILIDSQKTRRIEFKKDQLEKFYYPLQSHLKRGIGIEPLESLNEVAKYQYLAKENTRELFLKHTWIIDRDPETTDSDLWIEFTAAIDSDINYLLAELNSLID